MLDKKIKVAFLVALEIIFCFTPLGTIPIGPIAATLSMVPVIIASLTFGKNYGMLLGFVFAVLSLIYWTFIMPSFPTAFLFSPFAAFATYKGNVGSLIICFVPRVLGGLVPALVSGIDSLKDEKPSTKREVIASILGSLTNTVLVLLFIFIFFRNEYSVIAEKAILTVIGLTILTNGIPEAIVCAIVCPILTKVTRKI